MKKELKITISKTGDVQIDVQNANGSECLKWTKELEESLGGDIQREFKSEYYANETSEFQSISSDED